MKCSTPQCLAETTPTKRSEGRLETSPVLPSTIVSGWGHADKAKKGQSSALICLVRHRCGCLSPRRPSGQRPEQRPHLSCPPPQCLDDPMPTKRSEARGEPSPVIPATTVAG